MERQIKMFLIYLQNEKRMSENTLQSYERDIRQFKEYLEKIDKKYLRVIKSDIEKYFEYLKDLGKKPATISRSLATIKTFYKFLIEYDKIKKDPTVEIKAPKIIKNKLVILTENEIKRLLNAPTGNSTKALRDKAMLEVAYSTGMKVSEIINLNMEDIKFEDNYIMRITTKGTKALKLTPSTAKALKNYFEIGRALFVKKREENAIFINTSGKRLTRQGFWKILKYYKDIAHIDKEITPHMLRQSLAIHMIKNGATEKELQYQLGNVRVDD